MPGLDRTGPRGRGPQTGGGFGVCTGDSTPGKEVGWPRGPDRFPNDANRPAPGRGGRGRGRMNRFHATGIPGWAAAQPSAPKATQAAKDENPQPQEEVRALRQRLDELEKRLDDC